MNINEFKTKLQHKRLAIISAEKSDLPALLNMTRTDKLQVRLLFTDHIRCLGVYGGSKEVSFIIFGIEMGKAIAIARHYDQESILTNEALIFIDDSVQPIPADLENINFDNSLTDNYTEVTINGESVRFSIPLKEV